MLTLCCLTCCYDYKCLFSCCKEVRSIHRKAKQGQTGAAEGEEYECPWEAAFDPATKRVYYVNFKTGASQWERPSEMDL